MSSSGKNIQSVGNMFGSKPFNDPTNPGHPDTAKNHQIITNPFRLNDYDNNIINERTVSEEPAVKTEIAQTNLKPQTREPKIGFIEKMEKFISRKILPKVSNRFKTIVALNESLETFNSINANIDELIKIKTPFGEAIQNEAKLTSYIMQANKIQSQISKSLNYLK